MGRHPAGREDPVLVVGILGRIRATAGEGDLDLGGPRQRALLAALAVAAGRTVPTDALIDAVWDGDPPDAADRSFRVYVSRLRKALGRSGVDGTRIVLTDSAGYRLDDRVAAVDAKHFEAEVAGARDRLAGGQAAAAAEMLATALGRWEGRALGAFADRGWAVPSATRLEEQRLVAEELRVRALLDADRAADALARVQELAAAAPRRESVVRLHVLALYRAGRDADALRVAREFRERLAEEYGLDPSPQLGELETMVLNRDPRLDRMVGGRRLRGYVLLEPIARSPLGTVHRAEQPSIGREVAVTVLPPERADDPEVVRTFEARIQAVAGLEHPHLLPVYDYWREPGGAYVVTRFPTGGTLAQRLRTGPLDPQDALRLGEQVGAALAAAHEAGVVHGDVGPDAVVVDDRGDAFVWAFALDPAAHPSADVSGLARTVATAVGPGTGADDGAGATVTTATLPEPAATAIGRALDPTDETVTTVSELAAAFTAARTGTQSPLPAAVEVGPNPYRGLAAFRETDAAVFFGRDALIGQLQARIALTRAVAVIGPSGAGKSSVVRAGLLPRLRADGAYVTTMIPGSHPLAELEVALSRVAALELPGAADEIAATPNGLQRVIEHALPSPDGELVLVVDQFEELFTLAEPAERDLLLTALRTTVEQPNGRVRLILAVRADFLGRVLSHPTAGPLVRDRSVMVAPLTDDELHEVVTGPAHAAGVSVEPALATAIVADATRFPGSLPMVQFALTEVFAAAEGGTMQLAAYRRIGRIEGVLGQRAEEVYAGLDDTSQRAAHALFQRLVVAGADGPPTRRRALRSELTHVPDPVIDAFGRARLLRFDHHPHTRTPTVEVSHEALFRAWPRLALWIEEDEDDLRLLGHLTAAATDWDSRGRTDADLYRGARLDAALEFAQEHRGELSATELAFLDAAKQRRTRQQQSTRQTVRRLRLLTGGLALGLVLALIGGVIALDQRQQAREQQRVAVARELSAAATAVVEEDAELAVLLALEAVDRARSGDGTGLPEAERALHRAVTTSRSVLHVSGIGGSVDWHPDGQVFVTEGPEESGLIDIRDAETGESVLTYTGHEADVNDVAFSPDGTLLATSGDDGLLRVRESGSDVLVTELRGRDQVWGVTFSPDGSRVAATWHNERVVRVLDVAATGPPLEVALPSAPFTNSLSFGPDGRRLAVASEDGVVVVDAVTGQRLLDFGAPYTEAVAWSPDGRWIAHTSADAGPRITDATTGEDHIDLTGHTAQVLSLDWNADGSRLATGAIDGHARVFEVSADGAVERVTVAAREGPMWGVALSADGDLLLTGDDVASTTRIWAVGRDGAAEWANLPTSTRAPITAASFTPDGGTLVVTGRDEAALLWDPVAGTVRARLGEDLPAAIAIEVSPDGDLVATVSGGDEVHVWDRHTGRQQFTVEVPGLTPERVAWSPGGELLTVGGFDQRAAGRIAITDRTGALIAMLEDEEPGLTAIEAAFSADGQWLVSTRRPVNRSDPTLPGVRVWDWARSEVIVDLDVFPTSIAVDPTGSRVAAGIVGGGAGLWNTETGARLATLTGHTGEVSDVAFSTDGALIATAGADGTVRLWRADTGTEKLVLEGPDAPVHSVAFGPDGDRLVSTSYGVARVWALDLDDLVDIAQRRVTRSLTDDECRQYLHVERCRE